MEKLVPVLVQIHDILQKTQLNNELKLPQIVVIGSQSVGKSSLLEAIIGKSFLPRGQGIVTRRPLEIQLICRPEIERDFAQFMEIDGEKIYDFNQLREAIEKETEKVAGKSKGVSDLPLRLKIVSRNVVDLLLIDLPGITKNPVYDQPEDIETKIYELILPYIKNENTIILAVSQGSDDLANSQSLQLARSVDPQGLRTIGVITQLDLIQDSADILNDLTNNTYPLRLGYVGVVLKSAQDLKNNQNNEEQLKDQENFFQSHQVYQKVSDQMGIKYLGKLLNTTLIDHIKVSFPAIKENIQKLIKVNEINLRQFGEFKLDSQQDKGLLILELIDRFNNSFRDIIQGKYLNSRHDELVGGARINYIFNDVFRQSIKEMDPFEVLSDEDIRTSIKNSNGLSNALFISDTAFQNLIKLQILRLREPSLQCSILVYDELRNLLNFVNINEIHRFDNLRNRIFEVMEEVLGSCLIPTNKMIRDLVEIETGYINFNHPDFVGGMGVIQSNENIQGVHQGGGGGNADEQHKKINVEQKLDKGHQYDNQSIHSDHNSIALVSEDERASINREKMVRMQEKEMNILDNKLSMISLKKKSELQENSNEKIEESNDKSFPKANQQYYLQLLSQNSTDESNSDRFFSEVHTLNLPRVPETIKLTTKPTKREITQCEMVQRLMSLSECQIQLIKSLYDDKEKHEHLLAENKLISKKRQDTKNLLLLLRSCLNSLNDLDASISL